MTNRMRKGLLTGVAGIATALFVGAGAVPAAAAGEESSGMQATGEMMHQKVNLNTASAEQLAKVKGIDQATAEAIVHYRQANGPFTNVNDLLKVKGMTKQKVEALAGEVTVNGGGAMEQGTKKW
jgi:competence protein ComEA